jgi:hypothetical protein
MEIGSLNNPFATHLNASAFKKKKEGKNYYVSLGILYIPAFSTALPDNRTRRQKQEEKQKRLMKTFEKY